MKRFRRILVYAGGTDGGRSGLRRATQLAQLNSAELTVVDVLPELPESMHWLQELDPLEELEVTACNEAMQQLEDLCAGIVPSDLNITTKILSGKPFIEIIREVLKGRYDLVIKTAEQPHGVGQRIFGTTALRLLRKCPCPVWIVKPDSDNRFERILAAVDVSTTGEDERRMNHDIIDIAASLANMEKADLHVATSGQLWMEAWLERTDKFTVVDMSRIARERTQRAEHELSQLVRNVTDSTNIMEHVVNGSAEVTIPKLVAELHIDLIVMGTVGRAGLSGLVMGNTSEQILDRVDSAVLALKPPGFVTPVQLNDR